MDETTRVELMVDESIPEKSAFEKLLSGFTKLNDATMNVIAKKSGIDTGVTQGEIFSGKKEYSPRTFINDVGERVGLDLEFGDDIKKNAAQKTMNFATDIVVSTLTDPLSVLSTGSKVLSKALLSNADVGVKEVNRLQRAISGGTIGALTGDSVGSAVLGGAIGGGLGAYGSSAIRGAGRAISDKLGDPLVNLTMKGLNPEAFVGTELSYSKAHDIAMQADKRTQDITRQVREMNNVLDLDKLDEAQTKEVASYLDGKNSEWHTHRNNIEKEIIKTTTGVNDVKNMNGNAVLYNPEAKVFSELNLTDKPDNIMYLQDIRRNGKFGNRYIIKAENGKFVKYGDMAGKGGFIKLAEHGKINMVLKNKELANMKILKSLDEFNAHDTIRYGITNKNGKALVELTKDQLADMSRTTNSYIGKLVDEQLAKEGNPVKTAFVNRFRQRNRDMIELYNKAKKQADPNFIRVEPIDFHTMEVKATDRGMKVYSDITEGFVRRRSDELVETSDLKFNERVEIETDRFKNYFLDRTEKEAMRLINNVKFVSPKSTTSQKILKFVNGYDELTKFIKQQHLTFSHTWVVNNFVDNAVKAYMTGGHRNMWETLKMQGKAALRETGDPVVRDILRLSDPNMIKAGVKFNDELTSIAKEYGAVSEGMFSETFEKGQISKEMLIAKLGIEDASKAMIDAATKSDIRKTYDNYTEFLKNTVGRTGTVMEASARLVTFKHHVADILGSDDALKALGVEITREQLDNAMRLGGTKAKEIYPSLGKVYEEASRVTNEIFFDYTNISAFEEQVMKRLFPYWTYFSRNFPQWIEMATSKPTELRNVLRLYSTAGDKPTDQQRKGLPDYMLKSGARMVDGKAMTMPNMSLLDSLNATTGEFEGLSKVHPLLKFAYQMVARKNEFGGELYPSNTRTGQVRLTGAGEKFAPFTDSIYRDAGNGNKLYTDSDIVQGIKTFQQNIVPVPLVDTLARAINKSKEGTPLAESLINLGPIKINTLKPNDTARTRMFRERQADYKRQNEMDIENSKRISHK